MAGTTVIINYYWLTPYYLDGVVHKRNSLRDEHVNVRRVHPEIKFIRLSDLSKNRWRKSKQSSTITYNSYDQSRAIRFVV